jgi:hypothetical protein
MTRHALAALVLATAVLLALAEAALAQSCPYLDPVTTHWQPLDADLSYARWEPSEGTWESSRARLQELHATMLADERVPSAARIGLAALLLDVLGRFDGTEATANRLRRADFKPAPCAEQIEDGIPMPARCAWQLPAAGADVPRADAPDAWPCAAVKRFASYLQLIAAFLDEWNATYIRLASESLGHYARAWENYALRGYSQFPWELLVNGWIEDEGDWGPDRFKLIVLHPSVGVLIGQPTEDQIVPLAGVLMLEAIGFVHYTQSHEQYLGLGAGLSAISVQPDALSAALLLHLASWHVGVSYGLGGQIEKEVGIFVTFDLTADLDNAGVASQVPEPIQSWLDRR